MQLGTCQLFFNAASVPAEPTQPDVLHSNTNPLYTNLSIFIATDSKRGLVRNVSQSTHANPFDSSGSMVTLFSFAVNRYLKS